MNLLFGKEYPLKNRYLHINAGSDLKNLPVNDKNLPVNKTCGMILALLKDNPDITYDELALKTGKTRETVRVNLRKLESQNLIRRVGSDKSGHWEVFVRN